MNKNSSIKGFTLTELLVSIAITSILMVGISVFFSSTFRNMFSTRQEVTNTQGQFVVSTILSGKMLNAQSLADSGSDYAVIQNDTDKGDKPFTFVGMKDVDGENRIVFKDIFVFNGRDGADDSQSFNVDNAGGITKYPTGSYFVTAALENKIYVCGSPSSLCGELIISENLNHPTDITDDNGNTLYITDSGNARILKIENPGPSQVESEVVTGLDFPTGIAYYKAPSNEEYLFVSEPYENRVLKVKISDGTYEVVVGEGDDETCSGTASLCKLNFPTGVFVENDGGVGLFIADTGNGRVLKISDPVIDLSDVELETTLSSDTEISLINFTFPTDSDLSNVVHGSSDDELHEGLYAGFGNVLTYSLTSTYDTQDIVQTGCPDSCTDNFRGFNIDENYNIFQIADSVEVESSSYSVSSLTTGNVRLTPWNSTLPGDGKNAFITNTFSADTYSFYLDLSSADIPGGFQEVEIKAYDRSATPVEVASDNQVLRFPDGELGTEEDEISVLASGYDYPTGLSTLGSSLVASESAVLDASGLSDYDYIGDFEINSFSTSTMNSGKILELNFEGKLKEDNEGVDVWETYHFNASLN